jgi:hypothetical protein
MGDQWVGWEEERKNQGAGAGYWVGLGCVWFRVGKEEQSVIKSSIDLIEHHIHQLISNVLLTCLIFHKFKWRDFIMKLFKKLSLFMCSCFKLSNFLIGF